MLVPREWAAAVTAKPGGPRGAPRPCWHLRGEAEGLCGQAGSSVKALPAAI